VRQFGVAGLSSQASFLSLLYYLGMLTLAQQPPDISVGAVGYRLEIPNRVIRELQWEHLALLLKDEGNLTIDTRDIEAALQAMAFQGDIEPFLTLFHERVIKAMGLKDLRRFDEKSLKLMLLAFISLSRLFHPLSEPSRPASWCSLARARRCSAPGPRTPRRHRPWPARRRRRRPRRRPRANVRPASPPSARLRASARPGARGRPRGSSGELSRVVASARLHPAL
jgi:hypothetical protein